VFLYIPKESGVLIASEQIEDLLSGEDLAVRLEDVKVVVVNGLVDFLKLFRLEDDMRFDYSDGVRNLN